MRDRKVDSARGFAIVVMVLANMAPILKDSPPMVMRILGTLAAPIFVSLSSMMISSALLEQKAKTFSYYLVRGLFLILIMSMLDLFVYKVIPFISMDVLYLIGLVLPFSYLYSNWDNKYKVVLFITLLFGVPVVQFMIPYMNYPFEPDLMKPLILNSYNIQKILKNIMLVGWFPLFPWILFGCYGFYLAKWSQQYKSWTIFEWGLSLLTLSCILWWSFYPSQFIIRDAYFELFYPFPIQGVMGFFFGIPLILAFFHKFPWTLLESLGRSSLLIYIMHILIINLGLKKYFGVQKLPLDKYLLVYLILLFFLWSVSELMGTVKKKKKIKLSLIRWVIGG